MNFEQAEAVELPAMSVELANPEVVTVAAAEMATYYLKRHRKLMPETGFAAKYCVEIDPFVAFAGAG